MTKLHVHSKLEAVTVALRYRIIEPPRPDDGLLLSARPAVAGPAPALARPSALVRLVAFGDPPLVRVGRPGIVGRVLAAVASRAARSPVAPRSRNAPQRGQRRSSAKSDSSGDTV